MYNKWYLQVNSAVAVRLLTEIHSKILFQMQAEMIEQIASVLLFGRIPHCANIYRCIETPKQWRIKNYDLWVSVPHSGFINSIFQLLVFYDINQKYSIEIINKIYIIQYD